MDWLPQSKDHLPLTWWKQKPVYLSLVLALAGLASMVVTAIAIAVFGSDGIELFTFTVNQCYKQLWLWTPLTYVLVNPPSLWFLLTAYLFWNFGEAIERHLGRTVFVKLLVILLLATPILLTFVGVFGPRDWPAMGMNGLGFGVFIAFATLYPTAKISLIIVTIEAWLLASAIILVNALMMLASRNWAGLFVLLGEVAAAFAYVRYEQGRWEWPAALRWPKRPRLRVVKRDGSEGRSKPSPSSSPAVDTPLDAILDKISAKGISSLTDEEKRTLQQASERLGRRDNP